MINNLIDLLNPKGGKGVLESIIAIIIIGAIAYLNIQEIEVNALLEGIAWLLFGYMWGDRPRNRRKDDKSND